MEHGIVTIIIGVLIAVLGPVVGVTISRRSRNGRGASAKIAGGSAACLGVMVIIYGIYSSATAGG